MDHRIHIKAHSSSSSRILDIPCKVCGDFSSGKHYNIFACDGCAGFFKRSIRKSRQYVCKAKHEGSCTVDKTHRNQCRACRLAKCQQAGMNKDAVQHERGPRHSTLQRQQQLERVANPALITSMRSILDLSIASNSPSPDLRLMAPAFLENPPPPPPPRVPIGLNPTPILPLVMPVPTICERAAQLLLLNVTWAKNVPSFTSLPLEDQLLLLEESCHELFVFSAAHFLYPFNVERLMHECGYIDRNTSNASASTFRHQVATFEETLRKIAQFRIDIHEAACLRAIVLFKTTFEKPPRSANERRLNDSAAIAAIHEQTKLTLHRYTVAAHQSEPLRYENLLLLQPALRAVVGEVIEELFFRQAIKNTPLVKIISDMYRHT